MFGWRKPRRESADVAVIVSYASMESAFLPVVIEQCQRFSRHIVVTQGDRLFPTVAGAQSEREDPPTLPADVLYVRYPVDVDATDGLEGVRRRPTAYLHNVARWTGISTLREHLGSEADHLWVLLLDGDEVPDGDRVARWLAAAGPGLDRGTAYKMANYWHYADVRLRARTWEDSVVLVHMSVVRDRRAVFGDKERDHIVRAAAGCERRVVGDDGRPLFSHFSWCRSQRGLRQKLELWAHRDDKFKGRPVDDLVERVLSASRGDIHREAARLRDIVHGYEYDVVEGDAIVERLHAAIAELDRLGL